MFEQTVQELLETCLSERSDLFLIELVILDDNTIRVIIDGDKGVKVEDCVFVSRAIEHNLDREDEDFSLEVTSAGAASPFSHIRQYIKNVGRILKVKTYNGDSYEATMTKADENGIELQWKTREPKPIGKGKVTVSKQAELIFKDIKEAKVKIKF